MKEAQVGKSGRKREKLVKLTAKAVLLAIISHYDPL